MNVTHENIDLKHPTQNYGKAGFTDYERTGLSNLLKSGFHQMSKTAKQNNSGWRLDYFVLSADLKDRLLNSSIYNTGERCDHEPIVFILK